MRAQAGIEQHKTHHMRHWLLPTLLLLLCALAAQAQVVPVTVVQTADGWQLQREGKPYYVKGVGGHTHLDKAVSVGANSLRTWSLDNAQEILDAAQERGLTVMMGLWVGHERHGFDYDNEKAIEKQLARFRAAIPKYKDHPALLCWAVGNEVNLQYTNHKVWYAVNDIANMIQELDPNHPVTTVTAGLAQQEVTLIKERCPALDFLSVNTYGDLGNVHKNIGAYGWDGAYMITEWGPNGHWEVAKTSWGVPIEQTSSEKAVSYRQRYASYIAGDPAHCIGSYVFLWGQKQETTASWYGLFSGDGESTEAVDELQKQWTGAWPENRCPQLTAFTIDGKKVTDNVMLTAENLYEASIEVSDPDSDKLKIKWEVVSESTDIKSGGDVESKPPAVPGLIKSKKGNTVTFRAPREEGAFRLFVWVYDGNNHIAYANLPFYTKPRDPNMPQARFLRLKRVDMDSFNQPAQ